MSEILLLDADGVVIEKRQKYFSQRLEDDFGISSEEAMDFVKNALNPSMVGKVDIRQSLSDYLIKWNLKKSVDEMLAYWWSGENDVNDPVLARIDQLRDSGFQAFLVTDQERYRSQYLMEQLGLSQHFDGSFISYELGFQKHDREYWEKVIAKLGADTKKIYWDDDDKNILIASEFGIDARLFTDYSQFERDTELLV